jgi:hypothetical protein
MNKNLFWLSTLLLLLHVHPPRRSNLGESRGLLFWPAAALTKHFCKRLRDLCCFEGKNIRSFPGA